MMQPYKGKKKPPSEAQNKAKIKKIEGAAEKILDKAHKEVKTDRGKFKFRSNYAND